MVAKLQLALIVVKFLANGVAGSRNISSDPKKSRRTLICMLYRFFVEKTLAQKNLRIRVMRLSWVFIDTI